jgi:solute carrier family 25 carnitine/acylcarnitine transporter 20/29
MSVNDLYNELEQAATETTKDTAAGIASAVSQTLVGYPFNTVKVRLQVSAPGQFRGPIHCAAELLKKEGLGGMYKGMAPMMLGQQLTNITLFATYQRIRRLLDPNYAFVGAGDCQM